MCAVSFAFLGDFSLLIIVRASPSTKIFQNPSSSIKIRVCKNAFVSSHC
ncbi:hypothetical protein V6Z12_A07G187100 [Gossypium hirsutum]